MIRYDARAGVLIMSLDDLEACGFRTELLDSALHCQGVIASLDDEGAVRWPVALVVEMRCAIAGMRTDAPPWIASSRGEYHEAFERLVSAISNGGSDV